MSLDGPDRVRESSDPASCCAASVSVISAVETREALLQAEIEKASSFKLPINERDHVNQVRFLLRQGCSTEEIMQVVEQYMARPSEMAEDDVHRRATAYRDLAAWFRPYNSSEVEIRPDMDLSLAKALCEAALRLPWQSAAEGNASAVEVRQKIKDAYMHKISSDVQLLGIMANSGCEEEEFLRAVRDSVPSLYAFLDIAGQAITADRRKLQEQLKTSIEEIEQFRAEYVEAEDIDKRDGAGRYLLVAAKFLHEKQDLQTAGERYGEAVQTLISELMALGTNPDPKSRSWRVVVGLGGLCRVQRQLEEHEKAARTEDLIKQAEQFCVPAAERYAGIVEALREWGHTAR